MTTHQPNQEITTENNPLGINWEALQRGLGQIAAGEVPTLLPETQTEQD